MNLTAWAWLALLVGGPLLLLAAITWGWISNKKSRVPMEITEEGTRRVYEQEESKRAAGADGE